MFSRSFLRFLLVPLVLLASLSLSAQPRHRQGGRWDAQIQQQVTQDLARKDAFRMVHATAEDGIVTLTGQVDLFRDKQKAEKKARSVDHVSGVRNLIQVRGGVSDQALYEKLAEKLRYDRLGYGIVYNHLALQVRNGLVTVEGRVRDDSDRTSAIAIIERTPGVTGVVDNIRVAPASFFDDEIRLRAARAIYGDPVLQKYAMDPQAPIRIVVENGYITLYGVVQSSMERQVAEARARGVPGAFSVENRLVVGARDN